MVVSFKSLEPDPFAYRRSGLISDLKQNRPLGLALHDDGSASDLVCLGDISSSQPNQVAGAQFAVDSQIEKRQIAQSATNLQAHTDGPVFISFQGWFLASDLTLVPWNPIYAVGG